MVFEWETIKSVKTVKGKQPNRTSHIKIQIKGKSFLFPTIAKKIKPLSSNHRSRKSLNLLFPKPSKTSLDTEQFSTSQAGSTKVLSSKEFVREEEK